MITLTEKQAQLAQRALVRYSNTLEDGAHAVWDHNGRPDEQEEREGVAALWKHLYQELKSEEGRAAR